MHCGPTVLSRGWLTNICKTSDVPRTTDTNCDWPWLAIWVQTTTSQRNRRPSLIIIMMSFLLLLGTDGNAIQLNNSMIEDHTCNSINSIQKKNELILLGCLDSWRKIHFRQIYTWENNIGITTWRCLVSIFFLTSVRHSAIALWPNSRAHERLAARYPYLLSRRLISAFPKTYMGRVDAINSILNPLGMDSKSVRKTMRVLYYSLNSFSWLWVWHSSFRTLGVL